MTRREAFLLGAAGGAASLAAATVSMYLVVDALRRLDARSRRA
jgi:hypothetical protein